MVYTDFPDLLNEAQEILVEDGNWTGKFQRLVETSEGSPIFSKMKRSKHTWQLKKVVGEWTFLNFKDGIWLSKERWDPYSGLWIKANNTQKPIHIRVTKYIPLEEKISDEKVDSWGDHLVKKMYEQGIGYDIKIRLKDGQVVKAHKTVIAAACPAWKGLIESQMFEAETGVIEVLDINPEVVKAFVKALYCGEFDDQKLLPGLALMADYYNAEFLMHKVVKAMRKALETQGPDFYNEVVETLKRLPDTEDKKKVKATLYAMNKDCSDEVFYKRLGIN